MDIHKICAKYYKDLTKFKKFTDSVNRALPLYTKICQSKHIKALFFREIIEILIVIKKGDIQRCIPHVRSARYLISVFTPFLTM